MRFSPFRLEQIQFRAEYQMAFELLKKKIEQKNCLTILPDTFDDPELIEYKLAD